MKLEKNFKTALDESRLLILGTQILFGFQFQSVFQEKFADLGSTEKAAHAVGLALLVVSIGLLIAPSLEHQIRFSGETRERALAMATTYAGLSLFPFALALGTSMFVVFGHVFGAGAGLLVGTGTGSGALLLFYGLGFYLKDGREEAEVPREERPTPLSVKIEQLLTEARVLIPGAQALLGFQLIATFTKVFGELPLSAKYVHAVGLISVVIAVILLMTPAAIHRITYRGENSERFFELGSRFVISAALPIAVGVAADVYVIFLIIGGLIPAMAASAAALAGLTWLWLIQPSLREP